MCWKWQRCFSVYPLNGKNILPALEVDEKYCNSVSGLALCNSLLRTKEVTAFCSTSLDAHTWLERSHTVNQVREQLQMKINSRKKSLCCQADHPSDVVHHTASQLLVKVQVRSGKEGSCRSAHTISTVLSEPCVISSQNVDQRWWLRSSEGFSSLAVSDSAFQVLDFGN